ncbi:MAG: alpha-N-acetylglucosaminidase [Spirochaetales bacterium]|nr:alpha-N-acetylglucosaminidase [Spirochaetales bacterium]
MLKNRIVFLLFVLLLPVMASADAVRGLASRLIGGEESNFVFKIDDKGIGDYFQLGSEDGKVLICGNKPYSQAAGFYYYLKKYNGSYVGQMDLNIKIPVSWKLPEEELVESIFEIRNAYNYCTFSYTMAFWDWDRWERELDLLALYGVNQPLMVVGLEKVWQNTLRKLGFDEADIQAFIPSSAYKAWWLMGNLEGTGGPVSQEYIDAEYELAVKILDRMRDFGMEPISQGFFGMVPTTTKKYYPKARLVEQGLWGSFLRPYVLAPTTRDFHLFADAWYASLHDLYGKFSYYGGDLFHEGGNTGGLLVGLSARNVEKAMQKASPGANYVLQGWGENPKRILLNGLSNNQTLVQKLYKDIGNSSGSYGRRYGRKPWTLNIVSNFGGTHGLYTNLFSVAKIPELLSRPANNDCIGIGYLCEGTENNPVLYDLLSDVFWADSAITVDSWLEEYTARRYGKQNENVVKAWNLLASSIYNVKGISEGATDSVINARPAENVKKARSWSSGKIYWDRAVIQEAALLMLDVADEFSGSEGFLYDLTDIFRQVLQDLAFDATGDSTRMLELIRDTERLVASNSNFLLGSWLEAAYKQGADEQEAKQFVIAAKQLVTRWEPADQKWPGIKDYSNRTWSGLVGDYYYSRWSAFFEKDTADYRLNIVDIENSWIYDARMYPTKPVGDTIGICRELAEKWINK